MERARASGRSSSTTSELGHGASDGGDTGGDGHRDDHGEPAARGVLDVDPGADGVGESAGDGESEADAVAAWHVAETLEGREHGVPVSEWYAGTAVDDTDLDVAAGVVDDGAGEEPDRGVVGGVPHGVGGDVGEHAFQQARVGVDQRQVVGDLVDDAVGGESDQRPVHDLVDRARLGAAA